MLRTRVLDTDTLEPVDAGAVGLLCHHDLANAGSVSALFFSSRGRHTSCGRDWSSDVCSSDLQPPDRWQLDNAAQAKPYLDALAAGRLTEALNLAGVAVDAQLAKLLRGEPTRNYRAELTEKWVANLYAGLTESAPWRFAAAYAAWLAERGGRPKPAAMFGLKGLTQARKPKVVLDRIPSGIILRLAFSGGSLILPSALWTVPADLPCPRIGP